MAQIIYNNNNHIAIYLSPYIMQYNLFIAINHPFLLPTVSARQPGVEAERFWVRFEGSLGMIFAPQADITPALFLFQKISF